MMRAVLRPATKLAAYLSRHKIEQAEFSRRSSIRREVLWHYVSGDRRPGLKNALAIEAASDGAVPASYWPTFTPRATRRARRSSSRS